MATVTRDSMVWVAFHDNRTATGIVPVSDWDYLNDDTVYVRVSIGAFAESFRVHADDWDRAACIGAFETPIDHVAFYWCGRVLGKIKYVNMLGEAVWEVPYDED